MMQNQTLVKANLAAVGEEIGYELGNQFVKDYQRANPNDVQAYIIGRDIIDQILAQPGCKGIKFYYALNEKGEKTMVYVGLDANEKAILQYTSVNEEGILIHEKGIVADRIRPAGDNPSQSTFDTENWGWTID